VTEYLIKRHGFDNSFASWEPEENLSPGLLLAYRSRQSNGKYRISGGSTSTPVSIAADSVIFQLNGAYNQVLNGQLDQYLSQGWYSNGLGFNRYSR
jgi:hypothetical protein